MTNSLLKGLRQKMTSIERFGLPQRVRLAVRLRLETVA